MKKNDQTKRSKDCNKVYFLLSEIAKTEKVEMEMANGARCTMQRSIWLRRKKILLHDATTRLLSSALRNGN
jgi:hypothetical protein